MKTSFTLGSSGITVLGLIFELTPRGVGENELQHRRGRPGLCGVTIILGKRNLPPCDDSADVLLALRA